MEQQPVRVANAAKNAAAGILYQLFLLVFQFARRTALLRTLGLEYLGVGGVFSDLFSLLALTELGFGAAISVRLYVPAARGDRAETAALSLYYRRVCLCAAAVQAALGLCLLPFLDGLVSLPAGSAPLNIRGYYLIFLADTVLAQIFLYGAPVITAHQKSRVLAVCDMLSGAVQTSVQIAVLLCAQSFALYLAAQAAGTLLRGLCQVLAARRMFPCLRTRAALDEGARRRLWADAMAMLLYRVGAAVLLHTDSILISALAGTARAGLYGSYALIIGGVSALLSVILSAVGAAIGNFNALESRERQLEAFRSLQLAVWWMFSLCAVGLAALMPGFMRLWGGIAGRELSISPLAFGAVLLAFYLPGTLRALSIVRDTTGMFRVTGKFFPLTCILHLALAVPLGRLWGAPGVIVSASLARLLSNVWLEPVLIMRRYFQKPPALYFEAYLRYWLIFLAALAATLLACGPFPADHPAGFACRAFLCAVIPNALFALLLFRTPEFQALVRLLPGRRSCATG